eukprot:gene7083-7147_t
MEKAQEGLQSGSKFLNLPTDNMEEINEMFGLISHPREEIIAASEHIAAILDTTKHFRPELIRPYVKIILDNEQSYLLGMDLIVFDYDNFSKGRINQLKQTDYLVLGMVLLTLILEAVFIFYPLAKHIKRVVLGLMSSEDESKKLTRKLQEANENKEKSYNELREINFALDKATYLVKTDPEGKIIYANDKYCHVTKYSMSELRNKPVFYNNMGGKESVIYDHIRDPQKQHEVWQDEIFDYAKDGSGFWLDVTLIPVFDISGNLYQYLKRNWPGTVSNKKLSMMLTSVRMKLEQIEDRTDRQPDPEIAVVNAMLAKLLTETRRICSDLLPSVLEDFGLRSAIEDLVKTCKETDKKMEFLLDENIRQTPLSRELKISVYRILQEGLNNVIKHAEASKVEIYIDTSGNYLNLMVKDNGKGFHFDAHQLHLKNLAQKMNGIRGMKERAELLSDDHEIFRNGLRQLVNGERDMEVVGEAGDGEEALQALSALVPDVIIMDIRMPGINGVETSQVILKQQPQSKILFFSLFDNPDYVISALEMGASVKLLRLGSNRLKEIFYSINTKQVTPNGLNPGRLTEGVKFLSANQ